MFSGLSEYLWGSSGKDGESSEAAAAAAAVEKKLDVKEMEEEDDWVLVDVTNETDTSSPRRSPRNKHLKGGFQTSPKAVPDKPHHMEESWFITPPPCFTAGGHSPHQLATSPMENLLIEHPSMSVYHHPSQRGSNGGGARRQLQHPRSTQKPNRTVARRTHNLRVRNAKPPRRAAAIAARVGIEQPPSEAAIAEQREAKRHQERQESRGKVERHNKAYLHASASSRRHYRHNLSASGRHSCSLYKQPR